MLVYIIAAVTADGFIARTTDHLADWTSKEDKQLFVELTKRAGVMVMGHTTFKTIGRALPGRHTVVLSRSPGQPIESVEFTADSPTAILDKLQQEGYEEVAVCGGRSIYDVFLRSGLVDELYLTVEPVVFGKGVTLFADELAVSLKLLETRQLNDDTLVLHYRVEK